MRWITYTALRYLRLIILTDADFILTDFLKELIKEDFYRMISSYSKAGSAFWQGVIKMDSGGDGLNSEKVVSARQMINVLWFKSECNLRCCFYIVHNYALYTFCNQYPWYCSWYEKHRLRKNLP